jgi:hypothetical protein
VQAAALITVATSTAVLATNSPVSAYVANGCTWPSSSIPYWNLAGTSTFGGVSQAYGSYAITAASRWSTATQADWYSNPFHIEAIEIFNTNRGNDGNVGLSGWGCPGGHFSNPYSSWNEYYTYDESAEFNRGVMVHELGHTAGLSHPYESCDWKYGPAIMQNFQPACGQSTPQADDINGINSIY